MNYIIIRFEHSRKEEQRIVFNELYHSHAGIRTEKSKTTELREKIEGLRRRLSEQEVDVHMLQVERCKLLMKRKSRLQQTDRMVTFFRPMSISFSRKVAKYESFVNRTRKHCQQVKKQAMMLKMLGIFAPCMAVLVVSGSNLENGNLF